jgi:hypothetical protein
MRIAAQVSPDALHAGRKPLLRLRREPSSYIVYSRRNGHKLQNASAAKQQISVGLCALVLLVPGVLGLAQQSTDAIRGPVLPNAPSLQKAGDNQLLAAYSLAQPWRRALPPILSTSPSVPNPACATLADPPDRRWLAEWTSGKRVSADFERRVALISEPSITEYLNRLEQAIVLNSHLRGCFVVKLVNDVEANAYSLPGGFLYVTAGLILDSDNQAELVAALAHETGHVTARHLTKIEARRRIWRRLSVAGGPVGYALGWQLGTLFTLKLLRNAEFEADRLALKYQTASGYDPMELAHLFQDAFQQEGKPASFFVRLFDSHPSTNTRIKRVRQATSRYPQIQTDYVVDTSEFHEVKMRVADVLRVTNPDLRPLGRASCGGA